MSRIHNFKIGLLVFLVWCVLVIVILINLYKALYRDPDILNNLSITDFELKLDTKTFTDTEIFNQLLKKSPNLPVQYISTTSHEFKYYENESCAVYPGLYDLEFNNLYFQTLSTSNGIFQIYAAYFDNRKLVTNGPVLRVLAMIDKYQPNQTYCQMWFEGHSQPVISKSTECLFMPVTTPNHRYEHFHYFWPHLITCPIPKNYPKEIPVSVSLVENFCDKATNNVRVIYETTTEKKKFGVCIKHLNYPFVDLSVRFVEWIELYGMLGADKIFFYNLAVHDNVSKVLNYYEQKNKIELRQITFAGSVSNLKEFQYLYYAKRYMQPLLDDEVISMADCIYRNMYKYEYLVIQDLDEVILPTGDMNWFDLMEHVEESANKSILRGAYCAVAGVYFFNDLLPLYGESKDVPKFMYLLQNIYRNKNYGFKGNTRKCFYNPENILLPHNHQPRRCLTTCNNYSFGIKYAQLQHYANNCSNYVHQPCENKFKELTVVDRTILKYKNVLLPRTLTVLNDLDFY